jgi:hypothetical protein
MATHKKTQPVLRVRVKGPGIGHGSIPIPELLRICSDVQSAVNRQAEAREGEQSLRSGPVLSKVKDECTLELTGIGKGSTMLQFGFVKPQIPLPYPEILSPGNAVIGEVAEALRFLGNGSEVAIDPGVLGSFDSLGSLLDQGKVSEIDFIVPRSGKRNVVATFNATVRKRVSAKLQEPTMEAYIVEGILDMADFKPGDLKCRIDPSIGQSILCTFGPEREDQIYEAMRHSVRARGTATRDPHSRRIDRLDIQHLELIPPIAVGEAEFFASRSFSELAERQGAQPLYNPKLLEGVFSETEDIDELLAEIYQERT